MLKKLSGNTVIGLLFIIISGITLYIANTTLPATAPAGDPGSRIFPSAICIIIMILGIILIVQSVRKPEKAFAGTFASEDSKQSCIRAVLIFADLALFLVLWKFVPFLIAGMIFMFLQCMIFKEKLLFSVIYSAAVTGVLYVMFSIFLKSPAFTEAGQMQGVAVHAKFKFSILML